MSSLLLEPRDAGTVDMTEADGVLFDASTAPGRHGEQACVSTCVSGFTIRCDGGTFSQTCVTGATLRCDG
ncbi:cinnamycin family lantibiotic [Actinomadura parmotrematis]|uniref:Gallidermin/nisin family lantibiotic n=1 Tax=Actinomadura parmotrematis TaxID=2864039 RepID=A0ABS7FZY7_9ACTN|nr:cinnamycin family lantibiotic [Actinomadura parmotrematis]MBW8486014.1 hypothetical protein [Actinomadura parmotrematis]